VSRTFTRLKKQGTIGLPALAKVEIRDPAALAEMAEAG
jgi:hypothetical protein